VFAALLLARFQLAGAEKRLTKSQFGFRRGYGTGDANFATRRHIELAWAQKYGNVGLLALDWKKAFDSINAEVLIDALRRFGVPALYLDIISNIYGGRKFRVADGATRSTQRRQRAGISQGCPLSPFLFVMVMSVLAGDAVEILPDVSRRMYDESRLSMLLYADDTLLIGASADGLQDFLTAVAATGAKYGMELHWDKFQLLSVRGSHSLRKPNGESIPCSDTMTYLGVSLQADGRRKNELGRKLGIAWSDFSKLAQLWKHTSLSAHRKAQIFQSVVTSKLLYGLSSAWWNVSDQRRLDGFQAKCLRRIVRVAPAFISRVSNEIVRKMAWQMQYSMQLLQQQLLLYGKIAWGDDSDLLRSLTFCPGTTNRITDKYVRKVGRPRDEWAGMLAKEVLKIPEAEALWRNPSEWRKAVIWHCAGTRAYSSI
jgi:hypothetical protein